MIHYDTCYIKFRRNGKAESQTKRYQAANPGHAFQKCHREFPDAQLIHGCRQSDCRGEYAVTTYEPPLMVRIVAGPKAKEEQVLFGFVDEISLSPKKRAGAATHRPCN
jgi:hypothetical protein